MPVDLVPMWILSPWSTGLPSAGKERPEWKEDYLDYKALKDLIEESVRAAPSHALTCTLSSGQTSVVERPCLCRPVVPSLIRSRRQQTPATASPSRRGRPHSAWCGRRRSRMPLRNAFSGSWTRRCGRIRHCAAAIVNSHVAVECAPSLTAGGRQRGSIYCSLLPREGQNPCSVACLRVWQQVQKVGNFSQEHVKQLRADLKTLYDKVKSQKADSDKDAMIAVCDSHCLVQTQR